LQSVYSNVKTKLAETDRRMGLKKRFAAIGYADLRHPGEALRREMAQCAAAGCLRGYVDAPPDGAQVRREADALAQQLEDVIRTVEQRVDDLPAPQLEPEAFTRREGGVRKARLGDLGALRHSVDQEVAAFNARVPDDAVVEEAVAMAQRMMGPRLALTLGLAGERRLLDEVFGRFTAQSGDGAGPAELQVDAGSLDGVPEIDAELRRAAGWMGGGPSDDPRKYLPYLERVNGRLRELAQDFKAQRARALRARLASRIAGRDVGGAWVVVGSTTPSVLGAQRQRLEHAAARLAQAAALGEPAGPGKGEEGRHTSLTTREYPDSADAGAAWRSLAPRIDARVRARADEHVRGLARALAAGGAADDPAALLAQVEAELAPALDESAQVLDELQAEIGTLRAQAAAGDRTVLKRLDALEKLLGNLYSLSTPCCGIDPARLTPGETIPQVFIAASRLKEGELQTRLGLPTQPGIIDNDGTQLSLTQVLYAFPSHVVPGMDALRRAYEARDRTRSFPHVMEEWN
ncbi:MAG TPA: hypothetical protein VGX50_21620, partial [Longimicrobium sp.]|nr:hypothetical protein [Longimicrobium sp.]